jgi:hypothetical protein
MNIWKNYLKKQLLWNPLMFAKEGWMVSGHLENLNTIDHATAPGHQRTLKRTPKSSFWRSRRRNP